MARSISQNEQFVVNCSYFALRLDEYLKTGMFPWAMGPKFVGSTGTSPSNDGQFPTTECVLNCLTACAAASESVDKKSIPANSSPNSTPIASLAARRETISIWNNRPQPSPVFPSAAIPHDVSCESKPQRRHGDRDLLRQPCAIKWLQLSRNSPGV